MPKEEVVADVQPLDVTGTRTMLVGTVAWAVAFFVVLPFYGRLSDDGRGWWLWTCLAGVGLGIIGWQHCWRRERRLGEQAHTSDEASPIGAAGL